MDVSSSEDRRSATEPDADVSLRMRTATADAAAAGTYRSSGGLMCRNAASRARS